ncbi:acyl carrier protein [Streptomyces johnsoniae]|uniref:Acyl carrier protein n=1 Tax=Streptomyces johnsoniae TaxID=3075532 RepID=A0ABU2S149_9ACTN|nr:acyl carrier protein [Streptomyces sp. DSM 41886]MDT0441494.1 acyl carrier protein [Streptomyces sp. DSM 41886]
MSFDDLKAALVSMGVPEEEITEQAGREEAGLDSLGIAELVLILKQRHGLTVTEEELHEARTVGDVLGIIAGHAAAGA